MVYQENRWGTHNAVWAEIRVSKQTTYDKTYDIVVMFKDKVRLHALTFFLPPSIASLDATCGVNPRFLNSEFIRYNSIVLTLLHSLGESACEETQARQT